MAKSLRSKWRRKMKAVKRERYATKENERLVNMLIKAGDYQVVPKIKDEPMEAPPTPDETDTESPMATTETEQPTTSETAADKPEKTLDRVSRRIKAHRSRSRKRSQIRGAAGEEVEEASSDEDDIEMEETPGKEKVPRVYSSKTKRDQFGNYPEWFSMRKIQKQKKRNKRLHSKKLRFMKAKM